MGGGSYSRDVYGSSSGWGGSSSYDSSVAMSAEKLDSSMFSFNRIIESNSKHPIVIMLDVTGSNTDFAKIVYDKMPMFYGQIEQKGYLKDFDISVCAIGDAYCDDYPLQIADFSKGIEIDSWLKKLVLEGHGGGQRCETYELGAYYLLHNAKFRPDAEPIIFFLGDESPYSNVDSLQINKYVHTAGTDNPNTVDVFKELGHKVNKNLYMFLNPYQGRSHSNEIKNEWYKAFKDVNTENVIIMESSQEKAIVDLMLGVIAMVSESSSLDEYKVAMLGRGQTQERIDSVSKMLNGVSSSLVPVKKVDGLVMSSSTRADNKNRRL